MTEIPQEIVENGVLLNPDDLATNGGLLLDVPKDKRVELSEALANGAAEVPTYLRGAIEFEPPTLPTFETPVIGDGAILIEEEAPVEKATPIVTDEPIVHQASSALLRSDLWSDQNTPEAAALMKALHGEP